MKPLSARIPVILILCLVALSACAVQPPTVTLDQVTYRYQGAQGSTDTYTAPDGQTLQISPAGDGTQVTVNGQAYLVTGAENELTVTFPDGRQLSKHYEQNASSGSTAPGVEASMQDWNRVDDLREIVFHTHQNQQSADASRHYLIGAIIFAVGLLEVINPRLSWRISEGWRYANVEPSELYLGLSRLTGVVLMLVALFVAFQR